MRGTEAPMMGTLGVKAVDPVGCDGSCIIDLHVRLASNARFGATQSCGYPYVTHNPKIPTRVCRTIKNTTLRPLLNSLFPLFSVTGGRHRTLFPGESSGPTTNRPETTTFIPHKRCSWWTRTVCLPRTFSTSSTRQRSGAESLARAPQTQGAARRGRYLARPRSSSRAWSLRRVRQAPARNRCDLSIMSRAPAPTVKREESVSFLSFWGVLRMYSSANHEEHLATLNTQTNVGE